MHISRALYRHGGTWSRGWQEGISGSRAGYRHSETHESHQTDNRSNGVVQSGKGKYHIIQWHLS